MDNFLKVTAGVLVALILYLILNKQSKDFSVLLTIAGCCLVMLSTASFFKPLFSFLKKLEALGNFNPDILQIMVKAVGIGLLTEIVSLICTDAGNSSMGKALQILASVVILWLAIPLFSSLIDLIQEILVAI